MLGNLFTSFSSDKLSKSLIKILQAMPTAVCVIDEQGTILFANERLANSLGYTSQEMQHTDIATYGLSIVEIQQLLAQQNPTKQVKELVNKKQHILHVSVGASSLEGGKQILLSFDEVSEYSQTVGEKQFLDAVMNSYPYAVLVQDRRGNCRVWNKKAAVLFGKSAAEALEQPVSSVLPVELVSTLEMLAKEVKLSKDSRLTQQMSFKDAQGKEVVLLVSQVPILDKSSVVTALLTVFEDITEHHLQEVDLLQKRNLLQAILDHIPLGIYTRTVDGDMTYFNKQSQVMLAEPDPKYVNSPHPNQDLATVQSYTDRERKLMEEGKMREYPDEVYVDHYGKEKLLHIIKVPLTKAGPRPLVLSIVEDVTKKREQEREIIQANGFLSAILDNAPIGLYARTKTGKMLFSNKMSEHIFQDEKTQNERGFSPHETQEQVSSYLNREAQVLESGKPLYIDEEPYETADGKTHILRMVKVPVAGAEADSGFVITLVEDITERKEQEKKLEEYSKFQQAILDNAPLAIYAFSMDRSIVFANKKSWEMFPDDQVLNGPGSDYARREQAVFEKGEILDIPEEEYITKTGEKTLLHLIKVPIFDKDKKPFMMLSIAEDITLKKQQEREIHQAKNFLQNVVDNLPLALSVKKPSGEYVLWNKRSEEVFGVAAEEVIGSTNYRKDISREQAEFMQEADRGVFDSGRELNIAQELISTPKDGVKIMHTVKTPLYTEQGEPDYLLTVSEDITVQTNMERQVRKASEKNTLLVESAREGIVILEDRKVMYANQAAGRLLGFDSAEELTGKTLADFVSPDHLPLAKEKYEAVMNGMAGAEEALSLRFVNNRGAKVELETAITASKYLGRRIALVFLHDVTLANKTLRELRSERERFKQVFELGLLPALVLNARGYISSMNQAARILFHLTAKDRNFYRNVYMRPALSLEVRRKMRQGQAAEMDYVFDFDRAVQTFPGRIQGSGKMALHITLHPFNLRSKENGDMQADYLVTLERTDGPTHLNKLTRDIEVEELDLVDEPVSTGPSESAATQTNPSENRSAAQTQPQAQQSATDRFVRTISSVPLPAAVLDAAGKVRYVNGAFISKMDMSAEQAVGVDFFATFGVSAENNRQQFETAKQQAGASNAFQVMLHIKNHNQAAAKWDVFVIKDAQGQVEGYGLLGARN